MLNVLIISMFSNYLMMSSGTTYSDTRNYDAYGTRLASNDYFVILAQNDALRYAVSFAPFGIGYLCNYQYNRPDHFLLNVAVGRRQNSSQLSFVYLRTNVSANNIQKLGLFTFSSVNTTVNNVLQNTCNQPLLVNEGEHDVKEWNRQPSEMLTLQVDPWGKYAYGFLSNAIFIYDIERSFVQDLQWNETFSSITIDPHGLDVGQTDDQIPMAILAGYYQFDVEKTLPIVYLIRLNPPYNMTVVDNYTFVSETQKYVRRGDASTYQFNYVMSVSIHDATQQVLVGIPQLRQTFLFSFNRTNLNLIRTFNRSARSTTWLDENGSQAALLLADVSTLPWAQSRIEVLNISTGTPLYAYPNNQQTLEQWSNIPPTFIRLTKIVSNELVILASDGTMILVPWTEAGYYADTTDINAKRKSRQVCPSGTYKSIAGLTPCTICPTQTKSSSASKMAYFSFSGNFIVL